MENKEAHLSNVKRIIENAQGWMGVQPALADIDRSYLLIPKAILPVIGTNGTTSLIYVNETSGNGDPAVMRKMAYEYLALAEHVDRKKEIEAAAKLKERQYEAFKMLYPTSALSVRDFTYGALIEAEKRAIDVISNLLHKIDNQ